MKITLSILSIFSIMIGIIWFLQGVSILGGSSMTGQSEWAVYGGIAFILGLALLLFINKDRIFKR